MNRARRNFLGVVAAVAASVGAILTFGLPESLRLDMPQLGGQEVELTIASSVTKQKWLEAAVKSFAATSPKTSSGQAISIQLSSVLSGESLQQITEGTLQPVVWSPGEDAWVDQLADRWGRRGSKPISSAPCAPTVRTPVGMAMWQPMAEALGWPDKPISLAQIIALANDPKGWEGLGHPEWGRLRLGHTHPQYSSAGLLFLTSVIYAVTGKTEGITTADIYSPEVEAALSSLAQNTSKYGMVTTDLLSSMAERGPAFLHVASAFEEGTVRLNAEQGESLRWPMVFLFPQEGTFWSDHPYCILDWADWVSPEEAEAARMFLDHLLSEPVQADAGNHYIRPLADGAPLGSALSREGGTDPAASPATVPSFAIPSPEVSEAIIDQFLTTKRKATVLLVLDISGSMQGEPIQIATQATAEFLDRLNPKDKVGLLAFNDKVLTLSTPEPAAKVVENLRGQVLSLPADGGTNMHGALCKAALMLKIERTKDSAKAENRLYAIVLLSDGKDTTGEVSATRMFQTCLDTDAEVEGLRVFVLALGDAVDGPVLDQIAQDTRGARFNADPASLRSAYMKISAEN
jgi:Ca-activated chloride channel homolog